MGPGFTFVAEGTEPGGARRGAGGADALSANIATCQLRSRFCFSRVATLACCVAHPQRHPSGGTIGTRSRRRKGGNGPRVAVQNDIECMY